MASDVQDYSFTTWFRDVFSAWSNGTDWSDGGSNFNRTWVVKARFGKSQLLVSQCGQLVSIGDAVDSWHQLLYMPSSRAFTPSSCSNGFRRERLPLLRNPAGQVRWAGHHFCSLSSRSYNYRILCPHLFAQWTLNPTSLQVWWRKIPLCLDKGVFDWQLRHCQATTCPTKDDRMKQT